MLRVNSDPIDASALIKAIEADCPQSGGVVTFSGLVRPHASGGAVQSLFLQSYTPMTENGIRAAMDTAKSRWPLDACTVVHREGEMVPGDTIVFVATASKHRRAAFEAADFLMDYLKTKAVFWKKETTEAGATWIEPRVEDYDDASRWTKQETA